MNKFFDTNTAGGKSIGSEEPGRPLLPPPASAKKVDGQIQIQIKNKSIGRRQADHTSPQRQPKKPPVLSRWPKATARVEV